MKAAVLTDYRVINWCQVDQPQVADGDVLVKVDYASICGSDQHIFKGEFHPRTRLPLVMGHEFSGHVAEIGNSVRDFSVGDHVTVDPIYWCRQCAACKIAHYPACTNLKLVGIDSNGGFAEYVAVKEDMVFALGDDIPSAHGALVEVLSIGFHACNRAELKENDTLVILGAGKIGQCILQAAKTKTKNKVFIVDIFEERLAIAKSACGDVICINAMDNDPIEAIQELTSGRGVDVAIEAVGHAIPIRQRPSPVIQAIRCIRGGGTVCVLGLSDEPVELVMKELIWKEARLVASRVTNGEFSETITHLKNGDINPEVLISCQIQASQIQTAFELLENDPANYLKILLKVRQ